MPIVMCQICRAEVSDDSGACPKCGAKFPEAALPLADQPLRGPVKQLLFGPAPTASPTPLPTPSRGPAASSPQPAPAAAASSPAVHVQAPVAHSTRTTLTIGGKIFGALFLLWGIFGLAVVVVSSTQANALASIFAALLWIGGMVLLLGGTLLSDRKTVPVVKFGMVSVNPSVPTAAPADWSPKIPEGFQGVERGYPYRTLKDGGIEYQTNTGVRVAKDWPAFLKAIGG